MTLEDLNRLYNKSQEVTDDLSEYLANKRVSRNLSDHAFAMLPQVIELIRICNIYQKSINKHMPMLAAKDIGHALNEVMVKLESIE